MKYFILISAWVTYLGLHSLLASDRLKAFADENFKLSAQMFRFIYSLLSVVGLIALLLLMAVMKSVSLFHSGEALQYVAMILASWGVIIVIVSFRQIPGLAFLGLKKDQNSRLITSGIHGWIRHPIYSGTILIFIGMFLYSPTDVVLTAVLVNFAYLPIGIYLEEQKLISQFGKAYLDYRKEVKAIIPWVL